MNDLISRRSAIKAFDDEKYDNPFCGEYEVGYNDGIDFAVSTLSDLPSAQPKPRWIPVTERLPEAGIRYQVTFESGEVGYADFRNKIFFYDGSAKENVWEIERYYEDEGEVIAWVPLPEPYRKETEDAVH